MTDLRQTYCYFKFEMKNIVNKKIYLGIYVVVLLQLPLIILATEALFYNGRFNPYSVGMPEGLVIDGEKITEGWADMKVDNFNENSSDTWQNVIITN